MSDPGRIAFGVTASGEPATLEADLSTLFVGVTRSGKSNAIEAGLIDLLRKGEPVRLYISNLKMNELREFAQFKGQKMGYVEVRDYPETEADNVAMVERFEKAMRLRSGNMSGRKLTRPPEANPRCILWLDEIFLLPRDIYSRGPFSPLGRILSAGGAAMYTVLGGSQLLYSADLGSIKGLFSQRVSLRRTSEEITDTILGNKATARGAGCHKLHKTRDRGVGWVADQEEELVKFRAAHVTDSDLAAYMRGIVPEGMRTHKDPDTADAAEPERSESFWEKIRRLFGAAVAWARPQLAAAAITAAAMADNLVRMALDLGAAWVEYRRVAHVRAKIRKRERVAEQLARRDRFVRAVTAQ
jgi:hypothetical protein